MPSAIDRIRKYITDELAKGTLAPGHRLPSYFKLQEHLGYSYKTIQSSMRRLQGEKLVDIVNGMGCYIATPNTLKITFHLPRTTLDFHHLEELFAKHIDKSLRVEIELRDLDPQSVKIPKQATDVSLVVFPYSLPFEIPGLSNFEFFPGFDQMLEELHTQDEATDNAFYIPFYRNISQMGINLDLLSDSGFSVGDLNSSFDWWSEFNAKYHNRSSQVKASSFACYPLHPWWFGYFIPLFANLLINEKQSPTAIYQQQLFNTASGAKLLDIIASHQFNQDKNLFYSNKSVIELSAGTWLTMQKKTRKDFKVKNFLIKPYEFNHRKICLLGQYYLQTFMHHDLSADDRSRIWEVIKILTSKPFQLDFCNHSGMLSVRKDITREEYLWNNRDDFAAFVPDENDIIIPRNLFSSHYSAVIATLIEQYLFFQADKQVILEQLDQKIAFNSNLKISRES